MNILIISNSAPGYHRFFNGLGKYLAGAGHTVEFAVDSAYCKELNELNVLNFKIHEFASHFAKATIDPGILDRYSTFPLNSALLSDYERAEVYGIGKGRDTAYYLRLQTALLSFFEHILDESNIDFVLYESVSNTFAHFAWFVCKQRRRRYVGFAASRLPGRFVIIPDHFGEHVPYQATLQGIRSGHVEVPPVVLEWSRHYLQNIENIVPDYVAYSKLDRRRLVDFYLKRSKLKQLAVILKHINDDHGHAFQTGNPLHLAARMVLRKFSRNLKLKWRRPGYSDPLAGERYLLYPLHYHPESSTSIHAGTYLNEYEVIRNIAFSLPVGVRLYVKDHPAAYGNPPVAFYRRLASLPNVRIISPFANTKRLIIDSLAVITLTSTAGYEALMLKKRVFLFGYVFYHFHPNVVRIENPSKLFELLKEHIFLPSRIDDAYNLDFVAAYFMNTYPGILNFYLDGEEASQLVKAVAPILNDYIAGAGDAPDMLPLES